MAPPLTWPDVAALWPDVAAAATATQTAIIAVVATEMDEDVWGDLFLVGRRHLAAHMAQLAAMDGRGPVTAEAIGPASQGFASLATGENALLLTPAGREWLRLSRGLPTAIGFLS